MKCPNCGLINSETALQCDCGYRFGQLQACAVCGEKTTGKTFRFYKSSAHRLPFLGIFGMLITLIAHHLSIPLCDDHFHRAQTGRRYQWLAIVFNLSGLGLAVILSNLIQGWAGWALIPAFIGLSVGAYYSRKSETELYEIERYIRKGIWRQIYP